MKLSDDTLFCLLDVLGFENLFNSIGLEEIEKKYIELITIVKKQKYKYATVKNGSSEWSGQVDINSAYFSDTIVFWCSYSHLNIEVLFFCLKEIMCKSIELGIPLRGAVSVGKTIIDKKRGIYLGKPIITAARAEKAQKWIGITLCSSFNLGYYSSPLGIDTILMYDKHIKKGYETTVSQYTIDFPRHWRNTRSNPIILEIQKLNSDIEFNDYYINTIDFVKYSENGYDRGTKGNKVTKLK